jgi:transcription-repair coupling factor (superfamily II helicase)
MVVTYPEALTEKVISKKSLVQNSFPVKVGDRLDGNFLSEFLISYDFDKTDFVYEAGQFSIRGGIIDVFSYANDLPFRIELFGDEVESIRTFNPDTQLSVAPAELITIVPNLETKILQQNWVSFLNYFPADTMVWVKTWSRPVRSLILTTPRLSSTSNASCTKPTTRGSYPTRRTYSRRGSTFSTR